MLPPAGSGVLENGFSRLQNIRHGGAKGTTTQLMQFCSAMVLQEPERLLFGNKFSSPYSYLWLTRNDKVPSPLIACVTRLLGTILVSLVCTATTVTGKIKCQQI